MGVVNEELVPNQDRLANSIPRYADMTHRTKAPHFSAYLLGRSFEQRSKAGGHGPLKRLLKRLQGGLLFLFDLEQFIEFGDLEDLVDLRINIAQDELAAGLIDFLVERDELAQSRTGEIFHVAKIQEDLLATQLVDQTEKLLPDDLNILLIKDFLVGEINDGHIA